MGGRGASSATAKTGGGTVYENALKAAENVYSVELSNVGGGNISDQIPQWILDKNGIAVRSGFFKIKHETEKAILVSTNSSFFGGVDETFWVPKSQLQSAEKTRQDILTNGANKIVSQQYTNYLKQLASSNGVKLGNTSSWEKITAKLQKSGVAVKSRDEFKKSKA